LFPTQMTLGFCGLFSDDNILFTSYRTAGVRIDREVVPVRVPVRVEVVNQTENRDDVACRHRPGSALLPSPIPLPVNCCKGTITRITTPLSSPLCWMSSEQLSPWNKDSYRIALIVKSTSLLLKERTKSNPSIAEDRQ
jgi:hypothetical protein